MWQIFECPRCRKRTIPLGRRLFLGPRGSVVCSGCGGVVGLPPYVRYIFLSMLMVMILIHQLTGSNVLVAAAYLLMMGLYLHQVPLIPK
jgi:hypothetical protein